MSKSRFFSIGLLLFFAASFLIKTDSSFDQDLGRHLKVGEIIWQTHQIPNINLFSYTYPNFAFINHHWLFELLSYLAFLNLAEIVIIIIKILIIILSIALTFKTAYQNNNRFFLPLGFIFLHTLRARIELRPELFSFLFTALSLFVLEKVISLKGTKDKRKFYLLALSLPLIQLLWVNTHIYFPLGIILQGIFLISEILRKFERTKIKLLSAIFILSILTSFLNPNGLQGALYPFQVFSNYGYTIQENQNMFLLENIGFSDPNFLFVKISILLSLFIILIAFLKKTLSIKNLLLIFLGIILALANVRSFPYLFFISFPALMGIITFNKAKSWQKWFVGAVAVLIISESLFYLSGSYYLYKDKPEQPELNFVKDIKGGVDFLISHQLPKPILNNFDIGGYIIYQAFPNYRVFVDGRPETYPKQFFSDEYIPLQDDPAKFKEMEKKYHFNTIIFSITDQTPWAKNFFKTIIKDQQDWQMVYLDHFSVIFVRSDLVAKNHLMAVNIENLKPDDFNFTNHTDYLNLSLFLLNIGEMEKSQQFAKKALEIFPQSRIGNLIIFESLITSNSLYDQNQAQKYLQASQNWVFW